MPAEHLRGAVDLIALLVQGSGATSDFLPGFLACGGAADLLSVHLACVASMATAASSSAASSASSAAAVCDEEITAIKQRALEVLHTGLCDRLHGLRVRQALRLWLPPAIVAALGASADDALTLLGSTARTPDLIWGPACVDELRSALLLRAESLCRGDSGAAGAALSAMGAGAQGGALDYSEHRGLAVVGDVYLELLIKEPAAPLKDPPAFLDALVRTFLAQEAAEVEGVPSREEVPGAESVASPLDAGAGRDGPERGVAERGGGMVYEALVVLLRARAGLAPQLARAGFIKSFTQLLADSRLHDARAADGTFASDPARGRLLQVLRLAAADNECAEAMASAGLLRVLVADIAQMPRRVVTLALAVDVLRQCAQHHAPRVGFSLIECGTVEALLNLLSQGASLTQQIPGGAAARVQAIETLKALEDDAEAGREASARLQGSTVWENCKGQRHDLFLTMSEGPGSTLLLTASSTSEQTVTQAKASTL